MDYKTKISYISGTQNNIIYTVINYVDHKIKKQRNIFHTQNPHQYFLYVWSSM
jgi:hypothetical protein